MIDIACIVAGAAGIDDDGTIDDEQERVIVGNRPVLVAPIRLTVRYAIAQILDDAGAFADLAPRKYAASVQARTAHLDHVRSRSNRPRARRFGCARGGLPALAPHTATLARIAG